MSGLDSVSPSATIDTSLVQTEPGFRDLRPEWDGLVEGLDLPSPFHSWDWNYVWWKHFGARSRLHIVVFRMEGRVVGIAQLHERRHGGWLTSLVPIGWGNLLTEQLELLFPKPNRLRLMCELSRHLRTSNWSWIGIAGLEDSDVAEVARGLGTVSRVDMPFEYRELPPSWHEMVQGLNRSMRGNVKYYPRLIQRDGLRFEFRLAESPDEVRSALRMLYQLHSARAAAESGVVHKDYLERADHRSFLNDIASRLAGRGEMKVGLLQIENEVVAAQMWMERSGSIFLYYSGYLPAWSRYSVAMVVTAEILKFGIARGLRRVEFLRGTGQFKTRWDTTRRFQTEVTLARRAAAIRTLLDSYRGMRQALRFVRQAL